MWACSLVAAEGGKSRVSFRLDWISVDGCVLMPDHKHDIEAWRMGRGGNQSTGSSSTAAALRPPGRGLRRAITYAYGSCGGSRRRMWRAIIFSRFSRAAIPQL